jgi:putative ABC transport system permease protein
MGFSRLTILGSIVLECMLLSLVGGAIGLLGSMAMTTISFSFYNANSNSEIAFRFDTSPGILLMALLFALGIGVLGGLAPAIRAARVHPVEAMRR